jgi:hypothetical protein
MPFRKISLRGFKNHVDTSVELSNEKTILSGQNGQGKTSIIEAFIWALTGKDFMGAGDPKSYINHGSDRADVMLEHDNFTVIRGISRKSSQTIKFKKKSDKEPVTISQTDLENLLHINFDILSSVSNVGYFMTLDPKDRRDLLRKIVKTKSIKEIVSEIISHPAPDIAKVSYLDVKKDLAVITPMRLKLEKEVSTLTGALSEQNRVLEAIGVLRDESAMVVERNKLDKTLSVIDSFLRDQAAYDMSKGSFESAMKTFWAADKKVQQIDAEMTILSVQISPPQELLDMYNTTKDSRPMVSLLPMPAKPTFTDLPAESCYTCGQPVTERVKLAFAKRKNDIMGEYEQSCAKVTQENIASQQKLQEWDAKVKSFEKGIAEYQTKEADRKNKFDTLRRERVNLSQVAKPAMLEEPTTSLDVSQRGAIYSQIQDLSAKIQSSLDMKTRKETSERRIKEITEGLEKSKNQWHFYEAIERALKLVPSKELDMIKAELEIPGYELTILSKDDEPYGVEYGKDGTRYNFLSKGEKLKLNCCISKKIASLLKKQDGSQLLSVFFIDDQELLSDKSVFDKENMPGQRIITKVDGKGFAVVHLDS